MSKKPKHIVSEPDSIDVTGARVHNLKNVDISIPRNQLVVITGISGSGKSSLAFDTIYAEGQRRYLETLSGYARQFVGGMERPDVDSITGLSPVISIEQKTVSKNPRSTVGTITEIYDFLRLLFARASEAYSHESGEKMVQFTEKQIIETVLTNFADKRIMILAPVVRGRKGHYRELFESLRKKGFLKVRIDGEVVDLEPKMQVDRYKIHDIEAVLDRLRVKDGNEERIQKSIAEALKMSDGLMMILDVDDKKVHSFSRNLMDPISGLSYDKPSPNTFSYNSPYGMCLGCKGLGYNMQVSEKAMVPDPKLSINKGGVAPLGLRREGYLFKELQKLAKKYKFSLTEPVEKLPRKILNVILYGDEKKNEASFDDNIDSEDRWYTVDRGGVEAMLRRSFRETSSDSIRRWAEQFME
ncbi:MAG: excinuclease ABC subunit UvrA, partial [Chitinophagales bacterium]